MSKKSSSAKVFKNSIIYAGSGILLKCFSFFLLPLYTSYLTTEDYGITSIVNSFLVVSSFIVALSLYSAVMRFYVDLKDDKEKLKRFYGTIVVFVLLMGVGAAGILYIFRDILSRYVFKDMDFYPVILICILSLVFYCQHAIYENVLKSQQNAKKYAIISICYFFLTLFLNVLFVVGFKQGAVGVLLAGLIGYIVYFLFFIIDMMKNDMITFCIDRSLLRDALKYSIPIIPHNLSTQLAMLISKVLIGDAASLGAVGLYSIASQFGNIADTIQNYSDTAYSPWLFEQLKEKNQGYKDVIRGTSKILSAVMGVFFIGIALFAQDYIILFLDKRYAGSWKMVPLVVCVFTIKIMYYFYVSVLFYYKKASKLLFIATLTSSLVNILLSYLMIPMWAAYGSIFADTCAMIMRVIIIVVISKRYEDIGLRIKDFLIRIAIIVLFIFLGLFFSYTRFEYEFNGLNFLYKILVVVIYAITVFIPYRKEIKAFLHRKRNIRKNDKTVKHI